MKLLTTLSIISCFLVLAFKWNVILDNQRSPSKFKTEYQLEVINSDSIKVLTSNNNVVFCQFNELQEVIAKDNQ